jgi:hypothetical protein
MSNSISLNDVEDFISRKARALAKCHYAFSVVLSNKIYRELGDLFKKKSYLPNDDIGKYPWCHLKLITETYVRVFDRNSDDRGIVNLLEKEIGDNFQHYWEAIPDILKKLKLKRVREGKGPWYIYANVVLHAGIPSTYFNKLFCTSKEIYEDCNEDANRTIEELCEKKDIFKYCRFSKYFKRAFQSPTEKKLLFKWLVNLVEIKHWGEHVNRQLFDYLPGYLLNCLEAIKIDTGEKINIISDKIRKEKEETIEKGLIFNPDKNRVEYRIPITEFAWEVREKESISKNWKKALDIAKLKGSPCVNVPLAPGDLLKGITLRGSQISIFENIAGDSFSIIIFDFNYKAMTPGTKHIFINKENESLLTIISRNELPVLKKMLGWGFHEDLTGEWWDWFHYEWNVSPMIETVTLPLPYGEIIVHSSYERCNISGEWLSEVQLPNLS